METQQKKDEAAKKDGPLLDQADRHSRAAGPDGHRDREHGKPIPIDPAGFHTDRDT